MTAAHELSVRSPALDELRAAGSYRPETTFVLPSGSDAVAPAERRGLARDAVRLLVARPGRIEHRRFKDLADLLEPGDLLVVNTSATLPSAVDGVWEDGAVTPVHVSTSLADGTWVVELRLRDQSGPDLDVDRGDTLALPGALMLSMVAPYPDGHVRRSRLWRAKASPPSSLPAYLAAHGRPIEYPYLTERYSLAEHQTVYATQPGSAEMPSAGRPFTPELMVRLMANGVVVAPVVLHAGVSSPELHELPAPERFEVSAATARLVEHTRASGGRVVAVGTTVVRALESAADPNGVVHAAEGWTDLVLGPHHAARVVTGLVTGLHAPEASHLLLLEAVAGAALVGDAYDAAVERRYLWHEFGDSTLFLP